MSRFAYGRRLGGLLLSTKVAAFCAEGAFCSNGPVRAQAGVVVARLNAEPSISRGFAAKSKGGKKGGKGRRDDDDDDDDDDDAAQEAPKADAGGKSKVGKGAPTAPSAPPAYSSAAVKARFDAVLDALRRDLVKLRSGRAVPGMLAHIDVPAYEGSTTPLEKLGTVSARDAHTLAVLLFDPTTAEAVEKAIRSSPLGLNPATDGGVVIVPVPAPSAESRAATLKLAAAAAEAARASVRRVRKDAMDEFTGKRAAEGLSKDDLKRREKEVQAATDAATKDIAGLVLEKEKELKAP